MRLPLLRLSLVAVLAACVPACEASAPATAPAAPAPARSRAWIAKSDQNARLLLAIEVAFEPEGASKGGEEAADERVVDLGEGFRARKLAAFRDAKAQLEARRAAETDPLVLQDLAILVHECDLSSREIELNDRTMVPHWDVARMVFGGIQGLLDDQVVPARRARAVERLRKYVGMSPGTRPLTELARADVTAHLARPDLTPPARIDVEKTLSTTATLRDGIDRLFAKYGLAADEPLKALGQQLDAYSDFLRTTVLPRARDSFALPPAVYAMRLERVGVDMPPAELAAMAHAEFASIQGEMARVAATVAAARHLPSADYRDVIRELKKEQIVGDAILPHYEHRLADIEGIIRREHLITLPSRPARIRLGTPAESAQQPAPHMNPPRLIGNTGEQGEFVLPLSIPAPTGSKPEVRPQDGKQPASETKYDDFTYAAASWTLIAHEARPGHELQFDSMVEEGVSLARARYAFNSANAEGWGLYSEAMVLPYMPPEGQLVSLCLRLQRAARAFLDPELQQGKWTFDTARDLLVKDVVLSPAFATSEVERYTFRAPGQATSYYYGFVKMRALRKDVEARLGARFSAQAFHDEVLAEGLLPPDLLRTAVFKALGV